jgi:hypothetical protein
MARNSTVGYKGSLTLDKITGIRIDKGTSMWQVKLKEDTDIRKKQTPMSRKTRANYTRNGEQY